MDYVINIYQDRTFVFGRRFANKDLDGKLNICEYQNYDCRTDDVVLDIGEGCMWERKADWAWHHNR